MLEALRISPPGFISSQYHLTEDMRVHNIDIKKGDTVRILMSAVHTNGDEW